MKTIFNLSLYTIILLTVNFLTFHAQADDLPRKEISQLVYRRPMYGDPKLYEDWQHEIKSRKDINPDLLEMVNQEKDWELIGVVFAALGERLDLTENQLNELKKPMEQIASSDTPLDMFSKSYVAGVIHTLHNYPSMENEKLVLSFLDKQDGHFNDFISMALAKMGTDDSLPSLNKLASDLTSHSGRRGHLEVVKDSIKNIEKRESAKHRKNAQSDRTQTLSIIGPSRLPNGSKSDAITQTKENHVTRWPIWISSIVAIIMMLGLVWILCRQRR